MNGIGSSTTQVPVGQATTMNQTHAAQQQQQQQRSSVFFQAPVTRERETAIPDWKLRSLVTEYGLPANVRGLHLGGCF